MTVTITHVSGGAEVVMEIYDEAKAQGMARATVTGQSNSRHLSGNLKKESKWIVAVKFPDTGGVRLLRATAGYEPTATGAVRFDQRATGPGSLSGPIFPERCTTTIKMKPSSSNLMAPWNSRAAPWEPGSCSTRTA